MEDIFRVEETKEPDGLALFGELDIAGVPTLAEAIARMPSPDHSPLTFDLSGLSFIDSSGLNELLKAVKQHNSPVRLLSPRPNVLRVLDVSGVLSAFEVVDPPAMQPD
jgi:anti-anti-sigma factor